MVPQPQTLLHRGGLFNKNNSIINNKLFYFFNFAISEDPHLRVGIDKTFRFKENTKKKSLLLLIEFFFLSKPPLSNKV